jgi:hypothetical protein
LAGWLDSLEALRGIANALSDDEYILVSIPVANGV